LVAGEMEPRWNEKLVQLRDLEMQLGNLNQTEQTQPFLPTIVPG